VSGRAAASCAAQMHGGERVPMPLVGDRHMWLEQLAAQSPGEVAHVGCADSPYTTELLRSGGLLHARLARTARLTGIDVDRAAIEELGAALPGERFVVADVAVAVPAEELGRYMLVIAGEVLEHVPDADAFLRGVRSLLAEDGLLCVTVPNACCPKLGARALAGRESVHPDHRVYYGPRTLQRTLAGAGFELEWIASCFPPGAGLAGRLLVNPLLRAAHRLSRGPVGDGLIATARPVG
jgi:predicted TPR repeat methyltransferase